MTIKRGRHTTDAVLEELLGMTERELRMLEKRETRKRFYKIVSSGQITKDWLPIPVAAAVLGVTRRQVYALIKEKKLRSMAIVWSDGSYRVNWVTRASVARYAQERYTR